jgi:Ca2+-binding RTX toxin-like protein
LDAAIPDEVSTTPFPPLGALASIISSYSNALATVLDLAALFGNAISTAGALTYAAQASLVLVNASEDILNLQEALQNGDSVDFAVLSRVAQSMRAFDILLETADTGFAKDDGVATVGSWVISGSVNFIDPTGFGSVVLSATNYWQQFEGVGPYITPLLASSLLDLTPEELVESILAKASVLVPFSYLAEARVRGFQTNQAIDVPWSLLGKDTTGGLGDDTIKGSGLSDFILAMDGNDSVLGGLGADYIHGELGADTIYGGNGSDTLDGGEDADEIYAGIGRDLVFGGQGRDLVYLNQGSDTFYTHFPGGTNDPDTVYGGWGADTIHGGDGADVLKGELDGDFLHGHGGNDSIYGGTGHDTIHGGSGYDHIWGGKGRDKVFLGNGFDVFQDNSQGGDAGRDTVFGGNGNDSINGGDGNDVFYGEAGNDSLLGGNGNDKLYGGANADTLKGGNGNDSLFGGVGQDKLTGGEGADRYVFANNFGNDTVFGFDAVDAEKINLAGVTGIVDFADLVANHLNNVGGTAQIQMDANTILLNGVAFINVGVGLAYSADDFIF